MSLVDRPAPPYRPSRVAYAGFLLAVGVLVVLGVALWSAAHHPVGAAGSGPFTVLVDGEGPASVTTVVDGVERRRTGDLPITVRIPASARVISVVAQLGVGDLGEGISCSVADAAGDRLKQATSTGDYALVTCTTPTG